MSASEKRWPADKVERWPIERLVPYARNARKHSPAQVDQIAASIREWGWTVPVLADEDGTLIAGHGRVMAAKKLRLPEVPVMIASGWSDAQKRAYVIADNKLTLNGAWDDEMLVMELGDLASDGFDLGLVGYDPSELAAMLGESGGPGLSDPDEVPSPPVEPVSKLGDVWVMGRHRLIVGDSTDPDVILRLMGAKQADLCFTSPPYAQQRDYASGGIGDWDRLMQGVFSALPMAEVGQVLVNLGMVHRDGEWQLYWSDWIAWMRAQGWKRFGLYVWDQGPGLPGDWNGRLAPSFEFVFHFCRTPRKPNKTVACKWAGHVNDSHGGMRAKDGTVGEWTHAGQGVQDTRIPDNVIRVMRHKGGLGEAGGHPAVFPVDLPGEIITAFSDPDDLVFEPFCGSGTSIIAAQKNGRSCFAAEIAPVYADVSVKRWQNFSGQNAVLEGDGRTFTELASEHEQADQSAA